MGILGYLVIELNLARFMMVFFLASSFLQIDYTNKGDIFFMEFYGFWAMGAVIQEDFV